MAPMSMDIHKARHNCVVPAIYGFLTSGNFTLPLTGANEKNLSLIHGHSAVFNDTPFLVHCHNCSSVSNKSIIYLYPPSLFFYSSPDYIPTLILYCTDYSPVCLPLTAPEVIPCTICFCANSRNKMEGIIPRVEAAIICPHEFRFLDTYF